MFDLFKSVTKAALGVVFSPVSIAADIVTLGGSMNERSEPYTLSVVKDIMKNMDNAINPDDLTNEQLKEIAIELNKRR